MLRASLLSVIFLAACVDSDGMSPDVLPDDQDPMGMSGSALFGTDSSPPDVTLEWMVLGLSAILVGGSVRSRRRDGNKLDTNKFDL